MDERRQTAPANGDSFDKRQGSYAPNSRTTLWQSAATVLRYLSTMETAQQQQDAAAGKLVAGAVERNHV